MNAAALAVTQAIQQALKEKERVFVAIDGSCGSGKSTLAAELASRLDANLVHTDDFYLPEEMRTEARLGEVGGTVHRERLKAQVLEPLSGGETAVYRPLLVPTLEFGGERVLPPRAVNLIEGSYSMHPELRSFYDVTVFLSVEPREQERRILKRNGAEKLEQFRALWIPKENAYFVKYQVKEACALVFESKSGYTMDEIRSTII